MTIQAYRAKILHFANDKDPAHSARFEEDGLLVIGPKSNSGAKDKQVVLAIGNYQSLISDICAQYPDLHVQHFPDRIIAPGFVDMHIHYPQTDVIGSPADGLLPWLENYTFPEEKQYVDVEYAIKTARFFIAELFRNGVTTALTFATSHVASVNALFEAAQTLDMRLITGKCLQDRNCPVGVRDQTEQSLVDTEALIQRWHGVDRLGYAITPRFVPTCSDAQLRGAGELAAKYADVWIQSHVAENVDEIRWVKELYPTSRSYLEVYHDFGLMRNKAVYAHGIYLDAADRTLMARTGAAIAVSPTSNLFLGSGFFDYSAADAAKFAYGLASDVGGGTSFSPFHTMMAAYYVGRATVQQGGNLKAGLSLSPQHLWWQHTMGAAKGLGLEGVVGNLTVGCEADFVILNPQCTPLMARKMERCSNLDELLFAMIVLGDDRLIEKTVIAGQTQFQRSGI